MLRILLKYLWGRLGEAKIHPWRSLNRAKSVPRGSQERPRASKSGQERPRALQERPKSVPRASQERPRAAESAPRERSWRLGGSQRSSRRDLGDHFGALKPEKIVFREIQWHESLKKRVRCEFSMIFEGCAQTRKYKKIIKKTLVFLGFS